MKELSLEEQATNAATMHHISMVQQFLNRFIRELLVRGEAHDQTKLERPEVALFAEWTPKLAACTYGSPEYDEFRRQLGPALAHHYAKNRHHPEHFPAVETSPEVAEIDKALTWASNNRGPGWLLTWLEERLEIAKSPVNNMNLVDLIEMFCDWKAATLRHDDGNLRKSIEKNAKRFHIAPQIVNLMENTVDFVDG